MFYCYEATILLRLDDENIEQIEFICKKWGEISK
jgi:hypothetical protein